KEGYEGTLMVNKFPFFIIFLELDPSVVDFNVHPKKLHVRFEKEELLYNKVYNIIRSLVDEKFIEEEAKYISTDLNNFIPSNEIQVEKSEDLLVKNNTELEGVEILTEKEEIFEESVQLDLLDQIAGNQFGKKSFPDSYIRGKYIISKGFPKLRLISYTGQLNNKIYVVLEGTNENNEEGLFLLDQHAASERIKKEKLLATYEKTKIFKQKLIQPLKIEVSPSEKVFLEETLDDIKRLGFKFEHFGGNTFILREIPTIMNKLPDIHIIKEIISDITEIGKDKSFKDVKEEIINYLACHKSIRGGDDLSLKDIRNLLVELAACKDSYHCAHGRPTLKFISYKELDKLFKRTV
ncbi:MAG: DNA mismatch repair protein MutL, partial [Candidatus Lokiarchaeum sp. GC14_75]